MTESSYLRWLVNETRTTWWHDSADPDELAQGLAHGATGVTTNPVLISSTLSSKHGKWTAINQDVARHLGAQELAEYRLSVVVKNAAQMFAPIYERTGGKLGYVCAQVDPSKASDRQSMLQMAERFHAWAPNIAVKLPVTAAGLDVMEECSAKGIPVTATVGFTVPQMIAVAERYRRGLARARKAGQSVRPCFATIMIGRLDDYLRDIVKDSKSESFISESDIRQAGLAVTKRAYALFKDRNYETVLVIAALRGAYHMEELTGAEVIMSIHPTYQAMLLQPGVPRDPNHINVPIAAEVIKRLEMIPEFVRAYEPDGMKVEEFITYGATQRTLMQFIDKGWSQLANR